MSFCARNILLLAFSSALFFVGESARIKAANEQSEKAAEETTETVKAHASSVSAVQTGSAAQAGQLLHGRFRLESFVETRWGHQPRFLGASGFHHGFSHAFLGRPIRIAQGGHAQPMHFGGQMQAGGHRAQAPAAPSLLKVPSAKPGESFPEGTNFSDQQPNWLGAGQFGDVWEANDTTSGEKVAVKIFYRHTQGGGTEFLTWNTADQALKEEMYKNIKECKLVQEIIKNGKQYDPVGASRICECREEHITQGQTNRDEVMYTVWEMCGKSLEKVRDSMSSLTIGRRKGAAREMTKQVIEGIRFLNIFNPALIHHDMKADNAVVLGDFDTGLEVKLIDFGCFVHATSENKHSQTIGDPHYMPPEHSRSIAYQEPASSFDMYGAGLIHMELLCPALEQKDWSPLAQQPLGRLVMPMQKPTFSMSKVKNALRTRCPETDGIIAKDLDLISKLTLQTPSARLLPKDALALPLFVSTQQKAAPEPMAFGPGDSVEYKTTEHGWVQCVVIEANAEARTYKLGVDTSRTHALGDGKFYLFRRTAEEVKIRAAASKVYSPPSVDESFRVPVVAMDFKVGDGVEFFSDRRQQWFDGFVVAIHVFASGSGSYELTLVNGSALSGSFFPEKVRERAFAIGDHVLFRGVLAANVVSYDSATETYTLQFSVSGKTIDQIARDDVTARLAAISPGTNVQYVDVETNRFVPAVVKSHDAAKNEYVLTTLHDPSRPLVRSHEVIVGGQLVFA